MLKTICLNMIVKDESPIIEKTLENILSKIDIDYWVISDTGSSDNTREIITDFFFKEKHKRIITRRRVARLRTESNNCASTRIR